MERVQSGIFERFYFRTVYRGTLEDILGAFEEAGCDEVRIQSGDYKFESLDELVDHLGSNPSEIQLVGSPGLLRRTAVRINRAGVWVTTLDEDTRSTGLEVCKIIEHLPMWPVLTRIQMLWGRLAKVTLQRRHEGGWWKKNRQSVGLIVLGAVIAEIIRLLAESFMRTP